MKRAVTTILSLALALILVTSLGSGVILAQGPKEHQVAILHCMTPAGFPGMVESFDGPEDITLPAELPVPDTDESCVVNLAFLLNKGFKLEGSGTLFLAGVVWDRYTLSRKVRPEKDED